MKSCLFSTLVALAALALAGCGGEADGSSGSAGASGAAGAAGSSDAGGASGSAGGPGFAGGPTCSGQGGVDANNGGSGGKAGILQITTYRAADNINTTASALFASGGTGLQTSSCHVTTLPGCVVNRCSGDLAGSAPKLESAGTILIMGGFFPVTMSPTHSTTDPTMVMSGTDYIYGASQTGALYQGGEQLLITASGGAVPAFDVMMEAPAPVAVSAPVDAAAVDPAALSFAWTAGSNQTYVVVDLSQSACGISTRVTCTFLSSDGQGTVPAEALGDLHGSVDVLISGKGNTEVTAGDYLITLDALDQTGTGPSTLVFP